MNFINKVKYTVASTLLLFASTSSASLVFTFEEIGGDVTMTASGVLDTNNLVLVNHIDGWGGTGIEENGNHDIMGGTSFGSINMTFAFHDGTDYSEWASANGPWSSSFFGVDVITGTTSFTTYTREVQGVNPQLPGFGLVRADLVNGLWTADQNWTINDESFESLNMFTGIYTVTDAVTGEYISFVIGDAEVPVPTPLALMGLGLVVLGFSRIRKPA